MKDITINDLCEKDKLNELTKDFSGYKDLVESVITYCKISDTISEYDKDIYLNSIKKIEFSESWF